MAKRNTTNGDDTSFEPKDMEETDMKEVEGEEIPEPFKFENIGDSIKGLYISTGEVEGEFRKQRVYTLETLKSHKRYTIYSNADLISKMKKVPLGSVVHIRFTSEQPMGADLNPRRIFAVRYAVPEASEDAPKSTTAKSIE